MIGKTVSHYRIVSRLGAGGMGEVYRAEDTRLKRTVALKFLPPELTRDEEAKRRFQLEAEAAAALDHPNICTIYEVGETEEGHLFIAMACYEGETLKARLEKGPLPPAEAAWLAAQAAAGLAHAHAKGIVHRDVKPANLMLTADGGVKVLDFGLAKLAGQTTRTKDGSTLGTVAYMSPEQAGGAKVDARTDVWSLGAVLYEMATGKVPFEGDYSQAVIYGILNHDPVAPAKLKPDLPPELERVILLCLAKEPDQRIQTMAEVAAELGEAGVTGPVAPGRRTKRTGRWPRRARTSPAERRTLWVVAAIAALALVTTALVLWAPWRGAEKPGPWRPVRLTLAVLPFENLGSPDKEYVADGVTEEVTGRLAQVYGLDVKARTDVEEYKSTNKKTQQIAEELEVKYLLEGSVRWQAAPSGTEQLRVTAQLIRAADGMHLWTEQYDETAADILGKQSLIAEKVASTMVVKLVDGEWKGFRDQEGRPLYTRNAAAYECFQKGVEQADAGKLDEALKLWEQAVRLDPGFADAWLGQFQVHQDEYSSVRDRSERRAALAWHALEKMRGLEPDNPSYHWALGMWYGTFKTECRLAEEELLLADRGRPGDSAILADLSGYAKGQEKFGRALRYIERDAALHPKDIGVQFLMGHTYMRYQRYADAEWYLRRAMALDPERQNVFPYMNMAMVYFKRDGDPEKALKYLDSLPPPLRQQAQKRTNYGVLLWAAGKGQQRLQRKTKLELEQELQAVQKLPDVYEENETGLFLKAKRKAEILWEMGRTDEALAAREEGVRLLEKLAAERKGTDREEAVLGTLSDWMAELDRKEEAIRLAQAAVEAAPRERDYWRHFYHVQNLAQRYIQNGEYEKGLDQLEYYFSQPLPQENINMIRGYKVFNPILSHPRFLALAKKYPPDRPYSGP